MVAVLPTPLMPTHRIVAEKGSSAGGPASASCRSASASAVSKGLRRGPRVGARILSARSSLNRQQGLH